MENAYKNKGDQGSLDSYKGLFRKPVLRYILEKLFYVDLYKNIDTSLTDCNVGSRKRRNMCDNIFVVNPILNEAKQNTEEACDICVYDVKKCHDSLWLQECINDLSEAGVQDDRLALLFLENKKIPNCKKNHNHITTTTTTTDKLGK